LGHLAATERIVGAIRRDVAAHDGSHLDFATLLSRNEELEATNRHLALRVEYLETLALIDPLPGLGNRRHFDASLLSELRRAAREREPLTLLICDVDRFKKRNDVYGHGTGDAMLIGICQVLKRYCRRGGDLAFRYAGDEFALLWPGVPGPAARSLAHEIGAATRDLRIGRLHAGAPKCVTLSIGGATFEGDRACAPDYFVPVADRALYRAKRVGRDRARFGGNC
jgi:diguanylate cyclase (GGDEF)-like protein